MAPVPTLWLLRKRFRSLQSRFGNSTIWSALRVIIRAALSLNRNCSNAIARRARWARCTSILPSHISGGSRTCSCSLQGLCCFDIGSRHPQHSRTGQRTWIAWNRSIRFAISLSCAKLSSRTQTGLADYEALQLQPVRRESGMRSSTVLSGCWSQSSRLATSDHDLRSCSTPVPLTLTFTKTYSH